MASGKKASEGIALLSMYGDEEDEDEMDEDIQRDDAETKTEGKPENDQEIPENDVARQEDDDDDNIHHSAQPQDEDMLWNDKNVPERQLNYRASSSSTTTPQQQPSFFSPSQVVTSEVNVSSSWSRKTRLTIVDYGHDEGAASPETEEGEIKATGRVMYGEELQTASGEVQEEISPGLARTPTPGTQPLPPQLSEPIGQPESDAMNESGNGFESTDAVDTVMISTEDAKDVDPLEAFLPPPPKTKCSPELQEKIVKFLAFKKTTGRSFNSEVRNRKEYRNPDFLLHAVTYQDIDQIGSCFTKDVFDPHGYDKSDFYDEIEIDMRREMERREQERKKNQKVDFVSGGTQTPTVPTPKINMPIPGLVAAGGMLNTMPTMVDAPPRDGRQNKKSKWDKVDDDRRNPLSSSRQESSATSAQAAALVAANAGSGYSAFAQQRRKEAEDRRSSDKKGDRRT